MQKLKEAQEISEAVLDAEVKIGELMAATPKAANQYARDSGVTSKTDALKQAGFTGSDEKIRQMAHRFETLAAHPEIVAQAKAEQRPNRGKYEDAKRKQRPGRRRRNGAGPMLTTATQHATRERTTSGQYYNITKTH